MFGLHPRRGFVQCGTVHDQRSMSRRPLSSRASALNWFPCVSSKLLTKPMTKKYIKHNKHGDLLLSLAWAMMERSNSDDAQGRMLAKLYLTLHDHEELKRGFAGKYAHIRGGDVMQHLLSHVGEFSSTKHKFTRDADAAFQELETWMKGGKTWEEALNTARAKAEEMNKERRFASTRAPMLFSPAGMMALIVIAHPDTKYTDWIRRLQVSWMLEVPRAELDVQEGFWKGLNKTNLEHTFVREDVRTSNELFLVDYDILFGDQFLQLRQDIRPCLKSWDPNITVAGFETEHSEGQSICSDGNSPVTTPAPASKDRDARSTLQTHLYSPCTKSQAELYVWLACKLSGKSEIIGGWVKYWVYRIDKAAHYEEQLIVQSLFQQSLGVFYHLCNATDVAETTADVYMLSDMDEEEVSRDQPNTASTDLRDLYTMPGYIEYANVNTQLLQCLGCDTQSAQLLKRLSGHMAIYLNNVMKSERFSKYVEEIMLFEKLRTQILIQAFNQVTKQSCNQGSSLSSPSPPGAHEERILTEGAIAILKLTRWQLRQLVVPREDFRDVLTEWQLQVYNKIYANGSTFIDLSTMKPTTTFPILETTNVLSDDSHSKSLLKLLGDITGPYVERTKLITSPPSSSSLDSVSMIPAVQSMAPQTESGINGSTQCLSLSSCHSTPPAQFPPRSTPAPWCPTSDVPSRSTTSVTSSPVIGMRDPSMFSGPSKKRPFAGLAWKPSKKTHINDRLPKASKLSDMTKDEFSEEIKMSTQRVGKEIIDSIMDTTEELMKQFSAGHEAWRHMQARDAAALSASISHTITTLEDFISGVAKSLGKEISVISKTTEMILYCYSYTVSG